MRVRNHRCPSCGPRQRAFSLVELLMAMSVFLIVSAYSISLIRQSRLAWNEGVATGEAYASAMQAFDVLSRDLETAVTARDLPAFRVAADLGIGGYTNAIPFSELMFARYAPVRAPASPQRAIELIGYGIRAATNRYSRFQLVRSSVTVTNGTLYGASAQYYSELLALAAEELVADNIASFYCLASTNLNGSVEDYDSSVHRHRLPLSIETHIEVLSEEDARELDEIRRSGAPVDILDALNRRSVWFSRRFVPGGSHAP